MFPSQLEELRLRLDYARIYTAWYLVVKAMGVGPGGSAQSS